MASNSPAPEAPEAFDGANAGAWGEWNPTEDSVRPSRGRHRVAKQRGGLARSSTVLGVGVIAAVGAGGIATAQDRPQVSISIPSLFVEGPGADRQDVLQDGEFEHVSPQDAGPLTTAGLTAEQAESGATAGEALRNRILQQAESQSEAAAAQAKEAAAKAAEEAAAKEAAKAREDARKAAEEAAKAAAEAKAAAAAKAEEEARQALRERPQEQAKPGSVTGSWALPTSSYTLTSHYGDAGSMWSSGHHTGLDFAAPTGTPVKAVGAGKVISAGWSGAYGYRIVFRLNDGTEIWYCHLSSMSVTSGAVSTGETIGRVGATGNVTGAHLHLEVRSGGATQDPLAWLRGKGLSV
ncbi:M23 family metallopeptidase [Streptomyces bambusae]|uniref:M23 family metallopeptidase n=1 Tax=Streptomyces bambusae TaxID=1550616 RepID=UPI001D00053C|nr:M23 family metallopeptidase [Streptomyces bambusae]MCB5170114.1 M23 family metallopeptidase [Streptomyces bambusae]